MVSESGCQGISIPELEEDTSTSSVTSMIAELPQYIAKEKSDSPVQPRVHFPGSCSRSFQMNCYTLFPWIEYLKDAFLFCFPCLFFGISPDKTLSCSGFRYWKHARGKEGTLTFHDSMHSKHKEAVIQLSSTNPAS